MSLPAGDRIGSYTIVAPIGAGGMGEVYRARDSRLDRDVAIKILPPVFSQDPERLARFEREAKTLASLNHPNIAQIYGIESGAGGTAQALVMELVDGEDLSARITRGPVLLLEALAIAQQIADALEAAHERGIIHRDLKPANIKLSADGVVKVLDFGLAKAIEASDTAADPRNSPTMSMAGTRAGLILGTAAYMAPEQARGQTVDRRADIWAFGVVLFEMLSGKQAFSGETISDVLASVLKNDIDWNVLPKDLPAPVRALLRRCLNPDRKVRLRDIGEARVAIADYLGHRPDAIAAPAAASAPRLAAALRRWQIATAAVSIALLTAIGLLARPASTPPARPLRYVVTPPKGVAMQLVSRPAVSLSPDGQTLVFVGSEDGTTRLYLRGPSDFEPRPMAGTEGAGDPVFSPDGRTIAFVADSRLKTTVLDGATESLAPVNDPRGASWADANTLVYTPESIGGIFEVAITGGSPRVLTTVDEKGGERTHRWPHALPGGRWVLFTVGLVASPDNYDAARIDAVDRQSGERRPVLPGASMARYVPSGHLVFGRGGSLFAVKFDPGTLAVSGNPAGILQGVGGDSTTGAVHAAWSEDGVFAYVPGDVQGGLRQLAFVDRKGISQLLDLPPALYNDVRISPDGTRAAVAVGTSGLADIYVYTFGRGTFMRLTFTGTNATPVWSADGRDIFFTSIEKGGRITNVLKTRADVGTAGGAVATIEGRGYLKYVSRDGAWALADYTAFVGTRTDIGRIALRPDGKITPLVNARADDYASAVSPGERFVAYQSDESTRPEVYVRELAGRGARWQISNAGGEEPMWSRDGRILYYRNGGQLMAVQVDIGETFSAGTPERVFDGIYNLRSDTGISFDVHPDGARFLMARSALGGAAGSVRVITNWFTQLQALMSR